VLTARDAGVHAQERDLHCDDPAEHHADHPDAQAAAQKSVDDALVGQPADALERAGRGQRNGRNRARADGSGYPACAIRRGETACRGVLRHS
jgi:hypothetical protein